MRIGAAAELASPALAELFNRGYSGYYAPVHVTEDILRSYVLANDIQLEASRVVWDPGGPVAFAMLGIREERGWIGGMGVAPEARGRGGREGVARGGDKRCEGEVGHWGRVLPGRQGRRTGRSGAGWGLRRPPIAVPEAIVGTSSEDPTRVS